MVQSEALRGRTAVILGATSGIGRAIAEAYAAAGAHVAVVGRDAARGAVVDAIRAGGGAADLDHPRRAAGRRRAAREHGQQGYLETALDAAAARMLEGAPA